MRLAPTLIEITAKNRGPTAYYAATVTKKICLLTPATKPRARCLRAAREHRNVTEAVFSRHAKKIQRETKVGEGNVRY